MLIIDANVLSCVFDPGSQQHAEYKPIRDFVLKSRGILVSGGTKYVKELAKLPAILGLFKQLESSGQVKVSPKDRVDTEAVRITQLAPAPRCDDQHLIALVEVSGARVVASNDRRADKFLKDRSLYRTAKRPSIYRSSKHARLLRPLPKL